MSQNFGADDNTEPSPSTPRSPDSLNSITALARFEFEPGKNKDGTKILMVEWEDHDQARSSEGRWQVSWSGKTTVLPTDERSADNVRRSYFLLPPGTTISPKITLEYQPPQKSASALQRPQHLTINPLPAIFSPELGATARASGKKGVLHTRWAKKRLQVLEREIRQEQEFNLESIALEMAISEKKWIEVNFGIAPRISALTLDTTLSSKYPAGPLSSGLASPQSPGGRRLTEKLKGLGIGTSEEELAQRSKDLDNPEHDSHPLSPESSDIAFSSFKSIRNTSPGPSWGVGKAVAAPFPPDEVKRQQLENPISATGFSSSQGERGGGDDLFAKALSPRTPDVTRSPFSFSSQETMPYLKAKK